jgi:hypothetical protein
MLSLYPKKGASRMPQYKYLYKYKYGSNLSSAAPRLSKQVPSAYDFAKTIYCNEERPWKLPIKATMYGTPFRATKPPIIRNKNDLKGTIYLIYGSGYEQPYLYSIHKENDNGYDSVITRVTYTDQDSGTTTPVYPSQFFGDYATYLAYLKVINDRYDNHQSIAWSEAMTTIIIWLGQFFLGEFVCH